MIEIQDGSAKFIVRDKRMKAMIDMFYPVGSMHISDDKSKTKADFPFMQYGTWEEVPANLCLQTGSVSEAGTQRSAGLPNITGTVITKVAWTTGGSNGAFMDKVSYGPWVGGNYNQNYNEYATFDASRSNSIYGSSNTVQPTAYMVRAWVRTA